MKQKQEPYKELLIIEDWADENSASLTQLEAELMQGILAKYLLN